MRTSVIIPMYNEEDVIEDCLRSLAQQTIPLEIIVVDDGSGDNSKRKAQNAKQQLTFRKKTYSMQNLTILTQHHRGPGAARNLGGKHATGNIFVFVDADMTFAKDCIEKLVEPIMKKKTIGTFTKDERVGNWGNVWARCWNWNEGWPALRRIPSDFPSEAMVFRAIRRDAFMRAGGFDEDCGYTDDWSLARKLGVKSTAVEDATIYHTNPSTLQDVFQSARWIGRNEFLRQHVFSIVRFSPPISVLIGVGKAIRHREPAFLIFKVVYDFSVWLSVLESFFIRKTAK